MKPNQRSLCSHITERESERTTRRPRAKITHAQRVQLERFYQEEQYPDAQTRARIADIIALEIHTVDNWFNRRRIL